MAGIDIKTLQSALPDSFKEKGIAKVKTLILKKGQEVKNKLQPVLEEVVFKLPDPNELCLSENQIQQVLTVRNNIVDEINKIQKVLNYLTISIGASAGFLETLITTAVVIRNLKTAISLSTAPIPVVPGAIVSAINNANELLDKLKFDDLGNSKLNPIKQNLEAASIPIALTAASLKQFILTLNVIDAFLTKCSPDSELEPVNNDTLATAFIQQSLENQPQTNNSLYKGYTLEIEEKQYSPTLLQKRAIAKNSNNIVEYLTEYSFTSTPDVLIDELKLIIDQNTIISIPPSTTPSTTPQTNQPKPPPPPLGDPKPFDYVGKTIGERAGLYVGNGQIEDVYEWDGKQWNYIETITL